MKDKKSKWGGARVPSIGKKLGAPVIHNVPEFSKKLRATEEERAEFYAMLTGDARKDFLIILNALRKGK